MTWANPEQSLGSMFSTDAELGRMSRGFSKAHLFSSCLIQIIYLPVNQLNHHVDALNYVVMTQNCQFCLSYPEGVNRVSISSDTHVLTFHTQSYHAAALLWIPYLGWLFTHILRGSHAAVHELTTDGLLACAACRKSSFFLAGYVGI